MTLAAELAAANRDRSTQRQLQETIAAEQTAGTVRGVAISSDATGTTLETENGGRILVPRTADGPQGIEPTLGAAYQATTGTAGSVRLQINSRAPGQQQLTQQAGRLLYSTDPPTNTAGGQPGDVWGHIQGLVGAYDQVVFWRWMQPLGRWALVNGARQQDGLISSPNQGFAYGISPRRSYRVVLTSVHIALIDGSGAVTTQTNTEVQGVNSLTAGGTTVQINHNIGDAIEAGERITLTPTVTDGTAMEFSIGYVLG